MVYNKTLSVNLTNNRSLQLRITIVNVSNDFLYITTLRISKSIEQNLLMNTFDGIHLNQRDPNDIHTLEDTYQWLITGILNSERFLFQMEVSLGSEEEG